MPYILPYLLVADNRPQTSSVSSGLLLMINAERWFGPWLRVSFCGVAYLTALADHTISRVLSL
jgi:hypothetical protein